MRFKEFLFLIENNQFQQKKAFFINQGNQEQIVNYYINKFAELRKNYPTTKAWNADLPGLTIPKNKRTDINQYKTFKELEQIVDYVNGQVKPVQLKKVEIDGTPIHKDNYLEVYYAPNKHACIKYGEGYSWCVSRSDSSNMYNTLRYKQNEPSFYFVKNIEKTNKELVNNSNGNWLDKYHMFVIQADKQGYIVSSANNDGDERMSWEDIVRIEPHLKNLKHLFVHYSLSDKEKEDYKRFSPGLTDEQFKKLSYEEKEKYLDIYVNMNNLLTDEQFNSLSDDLKNKYISLGVIMPKSQFELFKNDRKLVNRHYEMMERVAEYVDYFVDLIINHKREDLIKFIKDFKKISLSDGYHLMTFLIDKDKDIPDSLLKHVTSKLYTAGQIIEYYFKTKKKPPLKFIKQTIINNPFPYAAYELASLYLNKNEKEIPELLINTMAKEDEVYYLAKIAKYYIDNNLKIPDIIMINILNNTNSSFTLAQVYLEKNLKVPDELLQSVLEDVANSVKLAISYLNKDKEVPDEIIKNAAKHPEDSQELAKYYLFNSKKVPDILIQRVSNSLYDSLNLAKDYIFYKKEVPDILIKTIITDPESTSELFFTYKDFNKVPEEILNRFNK